MIRYTTIIMIIPNLINQQDDSGNSTGHILVPSTILLCWYSSHPHIPHLLNMLNIFRGSFFMTRGKDAQSKRDWWQNRGGNTAKVRPWSQNFEIMGRA